MYFSVLKYNSLQLLRYEQQHNTVTVNIEDDVLRKKRTLFKHCKGRVFNRVKISSKFWYVLVNTHFKLEKYPHGWIKRGDKWSRPPPPGKPQVVISFHRNSGTDPPQEAIGRVLLHLEVGSVRPSVKYFEDLKKFIRTPPPPPSPIEFSRFSCK